MISTTVPSFYGNTLLIRGFAEFVNWKHLNVIKEIISFVKQKNIETVIWDGDLYKSDSFTHVIYDMMNEINANFIAYKPISGKDKFIYGDIKNCELGWYQFHTIQNQIYLKLVDIPKDIPWYEKNTRLTQYVYNEVHEKSSELNIMYLGGGKVIENELMNISSYIHQDFKSKTTINFVDVPRVSFFIKDGEIKSNIQYLGNNLTPTSPLKYIQDNVLVEKENCILKIKFI